MTTDDPLIPTSSSRPSDADGLRPVPRIAIQAFCETPEIADVLEQAAADRRMAKAHVKVHQGGVAAALDFYAAAPTPNRTTPDPINLACTTTSRTPSPPPRPDDTTRRRPRSRRSPPA